MIFYKRSVRQIATFSFSWMAVADTQMNRARSRHRGALTQHFGRSPTWALEQCVRPQHRFTLRVAKISIAA